MSDENAPQVGSTTWQPEYLRANAAAQGGYLEAVSAAEVVRQAAEHAMALLALQAGARVLEVGCGNGVFLPRLATAVGLTGQVVGIDHSSDLLEQARTRLTELGIANAVQLKVCDAYQLPFGDGNFNAAHCERVLMHLDEPKKALAEMARVVQPGGVVVAAEPDWAGIRLDHPDREAFDVVFRRALTHRNSDMGLRLFRLMGEVGLVRICHSNVSVVVEDFNAWRMYGLDLQPAVEQTAKEGTFSDGRLAALLPALEQASSKGHFYSTVTIHVVAGMVHQA